MGMILGTTQIRVAVVLLYIALIFRGLFIAGNATTFFNRLMAGAVTMIFFTYAFVNMGMVTGILPVVGVPLPFLSYGGTALVTLAFGCGVLMSVQRHKSLVQR
jgi:rod shape determining protein RodA